MRSRGVDGAIIIIVTVTMNLLRDQKLTEAREREVWVGRRRWMGESRGLLRRDCGSVCQCQSRSGYRRRC